jgi:hypothetical protein
MSQKVSATGLHQTVKYMFWRDRQLINRLYSVYETEGSLGKGRRKWLITRSVVEILLKESQQAR